MSRLAMASRQKTEDLTMWPIEPPFIANWTYTKPSK